MRRSTAWLAAVVVMAAGVRAPLVHLHAPEPHEHEARVLHAHASHAALHEHHPDGAEAEAPDEAHAGKYLDLFQARTAGAPSLATPLPGDRVELERPLMTVRKRAVVQFRNHDPPFAHLNHDRAPPV